MKSLSMIFAAFVFMCASPEALAKSFVIDARFEVQSENTELDESQISKDGWVTHDNAGDVSYTLSRTVPESSLPYRAELGDAYLAISKTGQISMGISIGDADASTETKLQWPLEKKKLVVLAAPLNLEVNGGEHASGAWGLNAKASFNVVK